MIKIKNVNTGEVTRVFNVDTIADNKRVFKSNLGHPMGERFVEAWTAKGVCNVINDENGEQAFELTADWEVVAGRAKGRKEPKANKDASEVKTKSPRKSSKKEPKTESKPNNDEPKAKAEAPKEPKEKTQREMIHEAIEERLKGGEIFCENFERIVNKIARGHHVYLYGPAGTGKSHTAEQIAKILGLDFYSQTTVQFAHDVRGYGDAGGRFVDTPFFKAFANGGLYFQDEYDRSNAEAAIVLNTALANNYYDFPVVGRVFAHKDFRFMAAGNTTMNGASDEYCTGQQLDASSKDRFGFVFEVGYLHEVEMKIAHNNAEIVEFVEDVRKAVNECGIQHVVSYRATKCMVDEVENEGDLEACITESVFKCLDRQSMTEIYSRLTTKDNAWTKAFSNVVRRNK